MYKITVKGYVDKDRFILRQGEATKETLDSVEKNLVMDLKQSEKILYFICSYKAL